MTGLDSADRRPQAGWQLRLGMLVLALSILVPVVGVPLVTQLGLSKGLTASVSGGLLVSGEVLGILAVAIMGKPGYTLLKKRWLVWLKRHGPPEVVSRRRYIAGLVLFWLPLLFGWASVYAAGWIPGFLENPLPYAVAGDLMLLTSLFVLGGGFWDKLHALFVHDAGVDWT